MTHLSPRARQIAELMPERPRISPAEAARLLHLSDRQFKYLVAKGSIEGVRVAPGMHLRVDLLSVLSYRDKVGLV